jgi:hypothetical protein
MSGRSVDLEPTDVARRIQNLPLQIGFVDPIEVVEDQRADAAGSEVFGGRTAEPAEPDDEHARRFDAPLSRLADFRKRDMPRGATAAHHGALATSTRSRPARSVSVATL